MSVTVWHGKTRIFFRVVASILVITFLWQQVSWAGDLIDSTLENLNNEQSQTFAPSYLQNQASIHQGVVDQKQAIEDYMAVQAQNLAASSQAQSSDDDVSIDLKGPMGGSSGESMQAATLAAGEGGASTDDGAVLSITTETGDIIHYKGSEIDYIEKKETDGYSTIRRIDGKDFVDADNNLLNAEITYPDNTIMIVSNGKTSQITKPDGTIFHYNADELIAQAEYPIIDPATNEIASYSTVNYSYNVPDTDDQLVTVLTDSEKSTYYDADNKLKRVEFISGDSQGKVIKYSGGILSEVKEPDGTTYVYDAQGQESEYVVKLKTIIDNAGVKYEINNNSITGIDLGDKKITEFEIGEDGKLIKAKIEYYNGTTLQETVLVENGRIKEIADSNNVRSTYQYDELAVDGSPVKVTFKIYKDGSEDTYTYNRDIETNHVKIISGDRTWEYNGAWTLIGYTDPTGTVIDNYSPLAIFPPIYIGSTFTLADGTIKEYDKNKNLVKTITTDGATYEYYDVGLFTGKLQKTTLPDGKVAYYEYEVTPEGNLKVYKRTAYDYEYTQEGYWSAGNISYTQNPTFKTTFKLDGPLTTSWATAEAHYNDNNDRSQSLRFYISNQKPIICYYSYIYKERRSEEVNRYVPITLTPGTEYTIEYVWTSNCVNLYVYETSQGRPQTPSFTLAAYAWNPYFTVSGTNAQVALDPTSTGTYKRGCNAGTSGGTKTLTGSPVYTSYYKFDSTNISMSYNINGTTPTSSEGIYFNYSNNTPTLRVYHYDSVTGERTDTMVPVSVTFNNTEYVIQTKLENNTLKLYIYEKGTEPTDPIYTMENVTWDPTFYSTVSGGVMDVEGYDRLEVYDYKGDSGDLIDCSRTADKEFLTYIYNEAGEVTRKEIVLKDGVKHIYDSYNKLLREEKTNGEITVYDYDANGNVISITPQFPTGTTYSYYDSGSFQGKLKEAYLPDGKVIYYDYVLTQDNNLKVYKRVSYDLSNIYQSAYSNYYISSSLNPTLKAAFKLDSTKASPYVSSSASYYNYNDKSVSLYASISQQKTIIYYYYYDYKTKQRVNDNRTLNITLNKDVTYNVEFVWTKTGVNIYLYEASQPRPATAIYTLANSNWNPKFSVYANNANMVLDPSSSGTYTNYKYTSTDYNKPLKNSPIHTATFKLNSTASYKSVYYYIYGSSSTTSDSISLNYYNNKSYLYVYHYDSVTKKYTNKSIPVTLAFRDNVTYVIQTRIDSGTLNLYIYEKGTTPTAAIYTVGNVTWDPRIYTNVYGGEMDVKACDNLEVREYNTQSGIIFDKDVSEMMTNKDIVIDDQYKTLPSYVFTNGAPLIFPDGITDIMDGTIPDIDLSLTMPSAYFDPAGALKTDIDFTKVSYFDVITYNTGNIAKVLKPDGKEVSYYEDGSKAGLVKSIGDSTIYDYDVSLSNNITSLSVERDGIKRIYDKYGKLQSLSLDDATQIVYENGQVKEIHKADGTIIKNMTFNDTGDLNTALISYPDGSVGIYSDAELLQLISATGDTTDYQDGKIRKVTLSDGTVYDWSYDANSNIIILDNAKEEKRTYHEGKLIELEELIGSKLVTRYYYDATSGDLNKSEVCQNGEVLYTYTYTYENNLTLIHDVDGNTQAYNKDKKLTYIVDSTGKEYAYTYVGRSEGYIEVYFPSGVKVRYDSDSKIVDVAKADGAVISNITFDASNNPTNFTYIKDDVAYKIVDGNINEVTSKDGTILYYDNGYIKSIQSSLEEYQYYITDAKVYKDASFFHTGTANNVSYYLNNDITTLALSPDSLQFGTGANGAKHVKTDEVLEAGTYNFTSLVIDAGKTLTVTNGAVIKCLDTLDVKGKLLGSNVNIGASIITVEAGGSIVGLNQVIQANTVNNSGLIGNVCMAPDTDFNLSGYTGTYSGPAQNAYDGNLDTSSGYYYRERGGNGYFYNGAYTTWAWTFDTPQNISTLAWKLKSAAQVWSGASENSGAWGVYITVTHSDGTTSVIVNESQPAPANGNLYGYSQNDKLVENNTGWTDVTKVEVKLYGKAKRKDEGAGGGNEDIYHYLYEMKADGADISYLASSGDAPVSKPYVYPLSGTFESDVMEVNSLTLDSMSWNENLPAGTAINIQTRTGNTLDPDASDSGWTSWSTTPMTNSGGSPMTTAQAKYIQYKITMTTSDSQVTPSINLSASSPLVIGFKRAPVDSSELGNISFMTRKKDGITYGYNTNGLLIWTEDASGVRTDYDPPDTANKIYPLKLIFDYTYTDDIKSLLPALILNDTQKTIYMKDNIIVSELRAVNNPDGSRSEYVQGKLSKIKLTDGAEITNISFDDNNKAKDFTYIKDDTTYIVRDKNISEVITSTGVHTKYYPYGMEKSIEDATSKIEYDYGIASGSTYTTNSAFQTGDFDDTSFYNNGNTAYLELSSDSLKYGTGIDGAKHVTANETLATGTYNFTSLVIDAGATLTVASGATIKVLDTLDVKGKLSGSNINLSAYTITVAQGGVVVGLDQTIQANTVNNSGLIGNVCMASDTDFNLSGYTGTYSGPAQNAYDGNLDTSSGYYYRERGGNGYFYNGAYTTWAWTFPTSQDISKLSWKLKSAAQVWSGASENSGAWGVYITVTHSDGTTSVIVNESQPAPANGNLYGYSQNDKLVENNTGWTDVTKVEVKLYGKAKRKDEGAGGGNEDIYHYLYEMKADGADLAYVNSTGDVPVPTMSSTHPLSGTFESDVVEVNALTFDKISWSQELPTGTGVTIQTRTGNTATPDDSWSEWSDPVSDLSGSKITSPNGKYFQYKVNLTSNDSSVSPKVILDNSHAISLSYTKFSDSLTDPYVKVKENDVTKAYNKEGVIIWEEDILGNRTTYDPVNPHETIELAPLKFDSTYTDTLKESLPTSKLGDAQKVITIYDQGNDTPVEIVSADQSITYFDNGFATKVVDKNGIVQVQYTYDDDHNIQKVEFIDARAKLEENYQRALTEIVTQKEAALAKLDTAEIASRKDITKKAADIQKQIDEERVRLTNEKAQYNSSLYDLSEFDKVFAQIDEYETQLQEQTADGYADLDSQVASARARINADASTAMQDLITNDYNKILADICQKESSPIIYQYYRKVLGRDPGDSELIHWTDKAKMDLEPITPAEITQHIQNLIEYTDRETRKQNIISSLTTFFTEYLTASEADRATMISSLGLNPSEIVDLTQADIDAIVSYLNDQSLHFGDSAFTTIVEMLESSGINKSFEDVGKEAIKIDILTGVITKDAKGDLVISMYAMRKSAEHNGLTLYSEKINYDDLKDQVSRGNVIVHIDGKHYVLVTAIDDEKGTITYTDLTVGENGQSMTLSRAEFMAKWKGYSMAKELPADPTKQLNVTQEKNIRGSGWWEDFWRGIVSFFQKIIAPVSSILMMLWVVNPVLGGIGAVLAALNVVIQTVSFVVRTGTLMDVAWSAINAIGSAIGSVVLPNIYEAAGKFFSAIGSQILAPIQGAFQSVMPIFETITTAVKGIATGIGQIITFGLTEAQIATTIGYNIISQGISLGTNYLFQSMNLDPTWSNIGSALLTGAIMGAISPNTNIVAEALRYGTIAGVEELGKAADLDPNITHLSAMIAGSLVDGALDINGKHLTYQQLMDDIAPDMLRECGRVGTLELGQLLGVDSRISYLASVGIGSSLGGYMRNPATGEWKFDIDKMWQEVSHGLFQGAASIGFSWFGQELDLDPLYVALAGRAISGALEGFFGLAQPDYESPNGTVVPKNILEGIYNAYKYSALNVLTMGGGSSDIWAQAAYCAKILDFSRIVQEKGFAEALSIYTTSIFQNDTIESLYRMGGFSNFFTEEKEKFVTNPENSAIAEIDFKDGKALLIKISEDAWLVYSTDETRLLARYENGIYEEGDFGIGPDGRFGLINGTITFNASDEYSATIYISQGSDKITHIDKIVMEGVYKTYEIFGVNETSLELGPDGLRSFIIRDESGASYKFENNKFEKLFSLVPTEGIGSAILAEGNPLNSIESADDLRSLIDNTNNELDTLAEWSLKDTFMKLAGYGTTWTMGDVADGIDNTLNNAYDWYLGQINNDALSILTATLIGTAKDVMKGVLVDLLRFGEGIGSAGVDWANGHYLAAGFNVVQDALRGTALFGIFQKMGWGAFQSPIWNSRYGKLLSEIDAAPNVKVRGKFDLHHVKKHGNGDPILTPQDEVTVSKGLFGEDARYTLDENGVSKYFKDARDFFYKKLKDINASIWEGSYIKGDGTLDAAQINIDFIQNNSKWRVAIDKATGHIVQFFEIKDTSSMVFKIRKIFQKGTVTKLD